MQVIIYGKDGCVECDKSKLLCQMQSLAYTCHTVGEDISVEALHAKVGAPVRSLPQIFIHRDEITTYVGGYAELRQHLQARH
jgi:glutaredoxin